MEAERWRQIEQPYHAALERAPAERAAFLDGACAGEAALRRQVAALLAADEQAAEFIEAPAFRVAAEALADEAPTAGQASASAPPKIEARIGAYQILSLLGRGGMGEVYLALAPRLGRKVALKLLPAAFTADAGRVRRFEQEARAASALNHPNILTIHEIVEAPTASGQAHYIVTEHVEGETLRRGMADAPQGRMSPAEVLDAAAQIAAALSAAHEAGIIHRDIKPENVMVRRDGLVKVLDFGLAKLTEPPTPDAGGREPAAAGGVTASGTILWTPRYMSPEQARGEPTGRPGLAAEYAEKAYALRDRLNEYEKLRIANWYHNFATGDRDQRIAVLTMEKRMFPGKWAGGPNDLASTYNQIGQSELAITESREALHLLPNFAAPYRNLGRAFLRLSRFADAKEAIAQASRLQLDMTDFHEILYHIAFVESDAAGMRRQLEWARGRPDEFVALDWQAGAAAFAGQWRRAREFSRHATDAAGRGDLKEVAAQYAAQQAVRGAVLGDCRQAVADARQSLALGRGRATLPSAAPSLALCGQTDQVKLLLEETARRYPEDTLLNKLWLPVVRAAADLARGDAPQALEQLRPVSRYEAAAEFWPQYLRGRAYLELDQGAEAAAEFQKVLDHRGQAPASVLYPLAYLGAARAAARGSEPARSCQAYQQFFALWKDADPDLPPLREAKWESGKVCP